MVDLDIVIPVYNEGDGILETLEALERSVKTPCRLLICYDGDDDSTLPVIAAYARSSKLAIRTIKNTRSGVHGAVVTGFEASTAPAVLVFPADDAYNAPRIDTMMSLFRDGCEIVCARRFMRGGRMEGCPWLKAVLVRVSSFTLYHVARLPTHDATNGLRLFSRRLLHSVTIESQVGFAFSLELLVKSHRLGWRVGEVPALWIERKTGQSHFRVLQWLPQYLRWYRYGFANFYFRKGHRSVVVPE